MDIRFGQLHDNFALAKGKRSIAGSVWHATGFAELPPTGDAAQTQPRQLHQVTASYVTGTDEDHAHVVFANQEENETIQISLSHRQQNFHQQASDDIFVMIERGGLKTRYTIADPYATGRLDIQKTALPVDLRESKLENMIYDAEQVRRMMKHKLDFGKGGEFTRLG